MHQLAPLIVIPLLIGAAMTFAIGIYAWGRRSEPGVVAFLFTSLGLGAWSIFYSLEILSVGIETKLFWHKLVYTMVPFVPGPWLLFLYQHNRRGDIPGARLPRWVVPALVIEPLLFIVLTWTNSWHGFIWTDVSLSAHFPDLVFERGGGFWLHTAYSYLLIFLATFIFMRMLWREPSLPRWQVGLLGGAALSPLAVNFIHLVELNPFHPLDLTPFALATTGTASAWYAFRFEIWDFLPAARNAIIESMGDGAIVLDLAYTVVDINPAALRLLGIERNAALAHHVDQILPNWVELEQRYLPKQSTDAQAPWELVLHSADGDRYVDLVFSRLYDRANRLTGSVLTLRDVTQRRRAEQALEQERTLLAQRVAEHTADLRKANVELARVAKMKDEFLASMSHELRTPLNTILGLAEAMQEQVYGAVDERQVRALRHIEESGRHLLALINDILDVSKIEAGKLTLELQPVFANNVCQASLGLIRQMAQRKNIEVVFTPDPTVGYLLADERRIKQVLVNLLSNAVKFTHEGGKVGIELAGDPENGIVRFVVWDTGIGIPPDDMERLFQPFVQLDSSLTRQHEGSGLGLALVYRMVALHGGSVSVESSIGQGSRFTVALPWQLPNQEFEYDRTILGAGARRSLRRVLLLSDTHTTPDLLYRYLLEYGAETMFCGNADEAVAQAKKWDPDLLVIGCGLPTANEQLALHLREQLAQQPCHVLYMTSRDGSTTSQINLRVVEPGIYVACEPASRWQLEQLFELVFQQTLPARHAQAPAMSARSDDMDRTQWPLVLVVEDNETNIRALTDYLLATGHRVEIARSGSAALQYLQANASHTQPDVVLMDIQMPGKDGLSVIRQIRADAKLCKLPIIALTALAMPGDREKALAAGADEYMSKPVGLKHLTRVIAAYLKRPAG